MSKILLVTLLKCGRVVEIFIRPVGRADQFSKIVGQAIDHFIRSHPDIELIDKSVSILLDTEDGPRGG